MSRVQIPHSEGSVDSTVSQGFGTPSPDESAALPQVSFRCFFFLEFINYCNLNLPTNLR